MRLGTVSYNLEIVVDLDNEAMVNAAADAVVEDICNTVKYNEFDTSLKFEENSNLDPELIPDWLWEKYVLGDEDDV